MKPVAILFESARMHEALFAVGDRFLHLATNSQTVWAYLSLAYGKIRVGSTAAQGASVDMGRIEWHGSSGSLNFDGREVDVPASLQSELDLAVAGAATLFGMAFRRMRTHLALYAAGLHCNGHTFALVGPRGVGKTTLVLEMGRRGWTLFGDEFLLLERNTGFVEPFALTLAVHADNPILADNSAMHRARSGKPYTFSIDGTRRYHGIDVADLFGARSLAEPAALTDLILVEREPEMTPRLERVAPAIAALRALPHFFVDRVEIADVWNVAGFLERVACRRLDVSNLECAADLLETIALE